MTQWTQTDPGAGDTAALRAQARQWDEFGDQADGMHAKVREAIDAVSPEVWAGQAADAWRARAEQAAEELAGFAAQLDGRARVMSNYARQVDEIDEDARSLRVQMRQKTEPEVAAKARRLLNELADDRRLADQRLLGDLDPVRVGDWSRTAIALRELGIIAPSMVNPATIGKDLAGWARMWGWGDPPSEEGAQELAAMLEMWGQDEQVMSAFFAELGGEGTLGILSAICHTPGLDDPVALALAGAVRSGLAVGSRSWPGPVATTFAAGLIDPLADRDRTDAERMGDLWSVSFLLADAAAQPLGERLAVAVADRVDLIERTRVADAIWLSPPHPATVGHLPTGMLAGFWSAEDPSAPYEGVSYDIAGRAFEHLGAHPAAALAWLTSTAADIDGAGSLADGRTEYWFGQRDWVRTGDGFAGPTALWMGAMNAPGGPADPGSYDPEVWRRVAQAMSAVTEQITASPWFLPENVSELASVRLAGVLAAQIGCLIEVPIGGFPDRGGIELNHFPGVDNPRWVASIGREQLAVLFGTATSSTAGLGLTRDILATTQDALLGAASTPGGYSPDEAIRRVVTLQVMLDAAPSGAVAGTAARADAHTQALIDTIGLGLSLTRIPGIDQAISALAKRASGLVAEEITAAAANHALDAGQAWLADHASGAWAQTYEDAVLANQGKEAGDYAALEQNVVTWAEQLQVPLEDAGGDYGEHARDLLSDYDELSEQFKKYAEQRSGDEQG